MEIELEKIFGFSQTELTGNRIGNLSSRQIVFLQNQFKRENFWRKISFFAFILPLFLIFGIAIYQIGLDFKQNYQPLLAFGVVLFIVLSIFFFFVFLGKMRSDLSSKKISMVKGFPKKLAKVMPRKSLGIRYYVEIEGVRFQMDSKKKFEAIVESHTYQIYFVKHPPTQIILSLEVLK